MIKNSTRFWRIERVALQFSITDHCNRVAAGKCWEAYNWNLNSLISEMILGNSAGGGEEGRGSTLEFP